VQTQAKPSALTTTVSRGFERHRLIAVAPNYRAKLDRNGLVNAKPSSTLPPDKNSKLAPFHPTAIILRASVLSNNLWSCAEAMTIKEKAKTDIHR
jgi:hypothetical protein